MKTLTQVGVIQCSSALRLLGRRADWVPCHRGRRVERS